jgi:hypothetical protein
MIMSASNNGTADTIMRPEREHRPFTNPLWPTSKPWPEASLPPPGQHLLSMRTDQMVYACSDQERGIPCVPAPTRAVQENQSRTPLPGVSLQEADSEAMERWLDDGGTLGHEAAYNIEGFSPLPFFKP